jgi:hypothetical protein
MNVQELIKELEKYPSHVEVYISQVGCGYSWRCTRVEDDDLDIDGCITLCGSGDE